MTLRCGKTVVAGDDFCGHCFRVSTLLGEKAVELNSARHAVAYVDEDDFSSETVMTLRCGKTVVAGDDFCGHCFRVSTLLGSECGTVDFTREDVLPLLNERIRPKDKYTLKQEKHVKTLDSAEKKCSDILIWDNEASDDNMKHETTKLLNDLKPPRL
ncbi:hypothetical protein QVD17_16831 [Tagetes erecta]|uniref:Uncharacterized protein n=1 Tax=Tagetes erecta TaxID=13708 RepID=A0AAD8NZU0_TARER|nr:hypothetical protein QVD17_16831 [Tagetes erecta]